MTTISTGRGSSNLIGKVIAFIFILIILFSLYRIGEYITRFHPEGGSFTSINGEFTITWEETNTGSCVYHWKLGINGFLEGGPDRHGCSLNIILQILQMLLDRTDNPVIQTGIQQAIDVFKLLH